MIKKSLLTFNDNTILKKLADIIDTGDLVRKEKTGKYTASVKRGEIRESIPQIREEYEKEEIDEEYTMILMQLDRREESRERHRERHQERY
jgi:uncharacterized protein YwqG